MAIDATAVFEAVAKRMPVETILGVVGTKPFTERTVTRLVIALGVLARKRRQLTMREIEAVRAGLEVLRELRPAAFEGVDASDPSFLRRVLAAAEPALVKHRGTPAKDAQALCENDPHCRPIELDGTGLSGTTCEYSVRRRKPLLRGRPQPTITTSEPCGELARWSLPSGHSDLRLPDRNVFCTSHAAAAIRQRKQRSDMPADHGRKESHSEHPQG